MIANKHPLIIKNLGPKKLSKMPTNGPMTIEAIPITETIIPISQGPILLTSPK